MSTARAEDMGLLDDCERFLDRYYRDQIGSLAQNYPSEQRSLYIDWTDLYNYDHDIATDYLTHPEQIHEYLEEALRLYDLPIDTDLSGADIRVTNVDDKQHVCTIPELLQKEDTVGEYYGVQAVLERVTASYDYMEEAAFECQRCGTLSYLSQNVNAEQQEPHECKGCERQGPFKINHSQSEFTKWRKLQLKQPPETTENGDGEAITVFAQGSLAKREGLKKHAGEQVTVFGVVQFEQQGSSREKKPIFKPYLDGRAIRFEDGRDDLNPEEYREDVEAHADASDVYDRFIDSIAPGIERVGNWDLAFQVGAVYLFGSPRIHRDDGSIHRGDIHVLYIGDPALGKSQVARALSDLSPGCEHRSSTGLASEVGLTAATVSDNFSETDDFTLRPGILPRAQDHVILEEIDKSSVDMTKINDALEGRQVVTVDKGGISATLKTRVGFMATGNPENGRFIDEVPVKEQIEIETSLLTRFDGIVVLKDKPDREDDENVAETILGSYREDAVREKTEREGGDPEQHGRVTTSRLVDKDVLRAWVMLGRQVFPLLTDEAEKELRDWYVDVRDMGSDDAIPATARTLGAGIRFSVAFARMRLSESVETCDVERAIELSKGLIGQTHDVSAGGFDADHFTEATPKSQRDRIRSLEGLISELEADYDDGAPLSEVVSRANDELGMSEKSVEHEIDKLSQKGKVYEPVTDHLRTT